MRHGVRSRSTIVWILIFIVSGLLFFRIYQRNNESIVREHSSPSISSNLKTDQIQISTSKSTRETSSTGTSRFLFIDHQSNRWVFFSETIKPFVRPTVSPLAGDQQNSNLISKYSSDEYLLALLRQQANPANQVIVTIIGGDSYSLFTWDWYERMFEISPNSSNCYCFVVAMDEIALILATKEGIPVFYSTFTFAQQTKWINSIEARQHSLYRVGHAKFSIAAKVAQLGYSVLLSEMDVFW